LRLLDRSDRSRFDRIEDGVECGEERFSLFADVAGSAHRGADPVVDRVDRAWGPGRCGLGRLNGDEDRWDAGCFDGALNMHDRAMTERSTAGEKHQIRRATFDFSGDFGTRLFEDLLHFERVTHHAEEVGIDALDRAVRDEFA